MIGTKQHRLLLLLLLLVSAPYRSYALVKRQEREREEESRSPKFRTTLTSSILHNAESSQNHRQLPSIHGTTSSGGGLIISQHFTSSISGFRMKDQPPVLDRLDLPQTNITLLLEEQQAAVERTHQIGSVSLWLAVASSALILLASATLPMIEMKLASTIAFIPWMWSPDIIKQKMGLLLVEIMATVQLFSEASIWPHVQSKILPWLSKNLEKMIYMELWRQAWVHIGKAVLNQMFQQRPSAFRSLPTWMQSSVRYVDGFFRRGTEKLFKKKVEKVIEHGVGVAVDFISAQQSFFTWS